MAQSLQLQHLPPGGKMSLTRGKKNKIIWSIDLTQNPKDLSHIVKELKIWAKRLNCDIQPVSIVSKSALTFPVKLISPWTERFEGWAQNSIELFLKQANLKEILPPKLIFSNSISRRKLAHEMTKFAKKENASLILASTRTNKKTWNPLRLGGFAETLVATSKVPVLLLNPAATPSTQIPNILFPTDFSRESKNALLSLLPLAKLFKSKIILYNQVEALNNYFYPADFYGTWEAQGLNTEPQIREVETTRKSAAEAWTHFLKTQKISSSIIIQRQKKYLGNEIIQTAKKNKVSLIALASHSGPLSQTLLGSVARDVILQAQCPVLVFFRPRNQIKEWRPQVDTRILAPKRKSNQQEVAHA